MDLEDLSLEERIGVYNEAMSLHENYGFGQNKIAKIMGLNPTLVKAWIYRNSCPYPLWKTRFLPLQTRLELYNKAFALWKQGIKKTVIARTLNVPYSTILNWIKGKFRPRIVTHKKEFLKRNRPRILNTFERGWFSAIIDGEGSIHMGKYRGRFEFCINVTNTCFDLIKQVQKICGCGYISSKIQGKRKLYRIDLRANAIRLILPQIQSCLINKKEQAQLVLTALKVIEEKGAKACREELENIYKEIRELNRISSGGKGF